MNAVLPYVIVSILLIIFVAVSRYPAAARSTRLVCAWVARPFGLLTVACLHVATACRHGCLKCLTLTEPGEHDGAFLAGAVISRLIYLIISPLLVIGGLPIDTLRAGALYGLAVHTLALPLDSVMGALFVLVPGCWALLLLEALGALPAWAHLLPLQQQRNSLRWGIGICSALLFLSSLFVVFFFNVYGQCILTQQPCAADASLQFVIVGTFSVLLAASGVLGLLGTIIGVSGLIGCLLAGISGMFYLLHFCWGMLGSCIATISQVNPLPERGFAIAPVSSHDMTTPLQLPTGIAEAHPTEQELLLMADVQRTNTILGFGSVGSRLLPVFGEAVYALGATATMLTGGSVDVERLTIASSLPFPGALIVSPSLQQINQVLAEQPGDGAYTKFAVGMIEKLVDAYKTKHGGSIIIIATVNLIPALHEPLRNLKLRLPNQHVLIVTMQLPQDQIYDDVREDIASLADAGIETYPIDPHAPFSRQVGEETQEKIVAWTIVGLCVSHQMDERNMTFAEVGQQLRSYAPWVGMSCAIAPVASGKTPLAWKMVKAVYRNAGERGTGDVADLIIQAKACTQRVLADVAAINTSIGTGPLFLVCMVPMQLADSRFKRFVAAITMYVRQLSPTITVIVVRANAPAAPDMERGYRCGVSACYPLLSDGVQHLEEQDATVPYAVPAHTDDAPLTASLNGSARKGRKPRTAEQ
jgi:hypothetical protein